MQACAHEIKRPSAIEMIETCTASMLLGVSERDVRRKVQSGVIKADSVRSVGGTNGMSYLIPVSSLPPEAQVRWRAMQSGRAMDVDLTTYKERKAQAAVDKLQLSRRARAEEKRIREEAGRAVLSELQQKVNAMEELALLAGRRGGVLEANMGPRLGKSYSLAVYALQAGRE